MYLISKMEFWATTKMKFQQIRLDWKNYTVTTILVHRCFYAVFSMSVFMVLSLAYV